jgi:hypothetical protein
MRRGCWIAIVTGLLAGGVISTMMSVFGADCTKATTGLVALPDLGAKTYHGGRGGLYPGGTNSTPRAYKHAGQQAAKAIIPRGPNGRPATNGKIVLLSIGMSNATMEFSRFVSLEAHDLRRHQQAVLVDGAQGGATARDWADPRAAAWSIAQSRVTEAGAAGPQVQALWLKEADANPTGDFDHYVSTLTRELSIIVEQAMARFPNLRQVFVSPRTYAGYATTTLNPEPYAYWAGSADKRLITSSVHHPQHTPWIGWGPYLWTDGTRGRQDGFVWTCSDVNPADGTHPSPLGVTKIAQALQTFFDHSPFTPWFHTTP